MSPSLATPDCPSPLQQAGVDERELIIGSVRLQEIRDLSLLRLRVGDETLSAGPPTAELPARTGQCSGKDPVYLCLGPREWLAISASSAPRQLMQDLQLVIGTGFAVAYDLTPGLVVLRLSGDGAPWLLSKLSCLDFIGGTAAGEHCARTRMVDAAVTVHYHQFADGEWCFDVIADRSLAGYLWGLLRSCAPHANELTNTFGAVR
jgi:heterotetrameric sarcosine oxidase gamma subunit